MTSPSRDVFFFVSSIFAAVFLLISPSVSVSSLFHVVHHAGACVRPPAPSLAESEPLTRWILHLIDGYDKTVTLAGDSWSFPQVLKVAFPFYLHAPQPLFFTPATFQPVNLFCFAWVAVKFVGRKLMLLFYFSINLSRRVWMIAWYVALCKTLQSLACSKCSSVFPHSPTLLTKQSCWVCTEF